GHARRPELHARYRRRRRRRRRRSPGRRPRLAGTHLRRRRAAPRHLRPRHRPRDRPAGGAKRGGSTAPGATRAAKQDLGSGPGPRQRDRAQPARHLRTLMAQGKRTFKEVSVAPEGDGFAVRLDERPLKTPSGTPVIVPSRTLAEAIASEWRGAGPIPARDKIPLTQ